MMRKLFIVSTVAFWLAVGALWFASLSSSGGPHGRGLGGMQPYRAAH